METLQLVKQQVLVLFVVIAILLHLARLRFLRSNLSDKGQGPPVAALGPASGDMLPPVATCCRRRDQVLPRAEPVPYFGGLTVLDTAAAGGNMLPPARPCSLSERFHRSLRV